MTPKKIIIHHSLTKDSETVSWGAIRTWHVEHEGYDTIGYHAGVELVGNGPNIYYEVLLGRMWGLQGAHALGQNHDSLGICFIGNYDLEEPSGEILEMGAGVIKMWLWLFGISPDQIYGHRHFSGKSCPGEKFNMEKLVALL